MNTIFHMFTKIFVPLICSLNACIISCILINFLKVNSCNIYIPVQIPAKLHLWGHHLDYINLRIVKKNNNFLDLQIGPYCPVALSKLAKLVHPLNSNQGNISTKQCHLLLLTDWLFTDQFENAVKWGNTIWNQYTSFCT